MMTEFEIKFYDISWNTLRTQLANQGFVCTHPLRLMKRIVFDNPVRPNSYFRIRDEGDKITCTYKQLGDIQSIEQVEEINIEVSDFAGLQKIFEAIGHKAKSYQETERETRVHSDGTECCLDRRPGLEPFIEIEGTSESIVRSRAEILGFEYSTGHFGAVDELYFVYQGIPHEVINKMPHISFDNPPRLQMSSLCNFLKNEKLAHPDLYTYATNILPVSQSLMPKNDIKELKEKKIIRHIYEEKLENSENKIQWIENFLYCDTIDLSTSEGIKNAGDDIITSFRHTFLSNFWPCVIYYDSIRYPSVEHAYLRQKFNGEELDQTVTSEQRNTIQQTLLSRGHSISIDNFTTIYTNPAFTSGNIKIITGFLAKRGYERKDWDTIKLPIMIECVLQKFSMHDDLKQKLLATGNSYLLEGNDRGDVYRGWSGGRGNNYLGRLLMTVRAIIRGEIVLPI